jgi:hypothetical protein
MAMDPPCRPNSSQWFPAIGNLFPDLRRQVLGGLIHVPANGAVDLLDDDAIVRGPDLI